MSKNIFKKFVGAMLVAMLVFSNVAHANIRDDRLVLPSGYAWVNEDRGSGMIFRADGTLLYIDNNAGVWTYSDLGPHTWYTNARNNAVIMVDANGADGGMSYSITNTTLTFDGFYVLIKTAVTIP